MQALVYEGPRIMELREAPIPVPGEGEVLIRVLRAGICGSEISGYLGHNSLRKPPLVMGHEFAGVVEAVGSGSAGFKTGDRVTVNPLVSCLRCSYCLSGKEQLCPSRQLLGAHRPGAFAGFVVAPASNVHMLPEHMSMDQGALVEPAACAVHVCGLLGLGSQDRLLITGAGPIGIFVLSAALAMGVQDIVITDINPERLNVARQLGGRTVSDTAAYVAEHGQPDFTAAVDAVGLDVTRKMCVEWVRPGGKVIFTGLHEADSTLPINLAIRSEISMSGAFAYNAGDFKTALTLVADGRMGILPWTEIAPLAEGGACFERLVAGPGRVVKYLLDCSKQAQ
jgi:2-desacetyl-2-hydroxyethyl bacteriochlorophyllide A dehydrogenase